MNKQESGYRWVVLCTVLLAYFLIVSQRTAPGLITDQLMKDFQVSAAMIGIISSIQFLAYAGLQIPAGLLSDRYGPNYFLIVGAFLTGVGTLLYSLAPNEYLLMFSRLLVGVGDATIFVNLVLILSQWFKGKEFVKLMGVVSMVASIGFLAATVPFSMWISWIGWRIPFFSVGVILVATTFLLYVVLISKPKKMFAEASKGKEDQVKDNESIWMILRRVFSTRQAWALFLCHFGVVGTYIGFIGSWGVPYGIHVLELSRAEASQLMMYGLFGALIGGPLISWISSKLGSVKKIYTVVHIMVACSWAGLFLSGTNPTFTTVITFLFIIGFGNGASALTFVIVRDSFPIKEVGALSGFANMGGFLSAVLLPSMFGKVLDVFSHSSPHVGYHYGLIIPVVFSFMGLWGSFLVREEKRMLHVSEVSQQATK